MKDNYGSLRRKTRDSGWQWMMVGLVIGVMSALVVCVGLYAMEEIRFPSLEDADKSDEGAEVQIVPNDTEIAAAGMQQQTAVAQQVQATVDALATLNAGTQIAVVPAVTTPAPVAAEPTLTPTSLPDVNQVPQTTPNPTSAAVSAPQVTPTPGTDTGAQMTAPLTEETPIADIGTPMEPLGLPQAAEIPAELKDVVTTMVNVDGGTFMMGTTQDEALQAMDECALYGKTCDDLSWVQDSTPTHQITVNPFQIELYEVTVAQYVAFLNWMGPNSHKTGCQGNPCVTTTTEQEGSYISFDGTTYAVANPTFFNDFPITFVTWYGAAEYCTALNRRLPTEAEWERAARGPQNFTYPWGFAFDPTLASSSITDPKGAVAVDSFPTGISPYGVYNMAGNVAEWVDDWYQSNYYSELAQAPQTNPTGPLGGTEKVLRGGSWDTIPLFLRSVHRMSALPSNPTASYGFRCAADASTTTPILSNTPTGGSGGATPLPGGAPTLPAAPTNLPAPTNTPSGPTPTLAAE